MKSNSREIWEVSAPALTNTPNGSRVTAQVAGAPLWFESPDAELRVSAEAYATLMFVPAVIANARIEPASPLDATWLANTRSVPVLLNDWWGCSCEYPLPEVAAAESCTPASAISAQFFSGGVDSMYTLLQTADEIDALVFVHGCDIDIDDHHRAAEFEGSFRTLAAQTGKQAIVVRTNARHHPMFRNFPWEKTHGAALAAVGHVLSDTLGSVRIASSWTYSNSHPWGSHWELDPHWSDSRLQVEHSDATLSRQEKIAMIANEPLAQQYLRVCWENLSDAGNCCRCVKCLRTMLSLHAHGVLDHFLTFDRNVDLAERLDAVPFISANLHERARDQLSELQNYPDLYAALERLIERQPRRWWSPRRWLRRH
jgi:hypothetical protein